MALIGGLVAAIITNLNNVLLFLARNFIERATNTNKRKADFHVEKRGHLVKLVGLINESRLTLSEARVIKLELPKMSPKSNKFKVIEERHNAILAKGIDALHNAFIECESYAEMPKECDLPGGRLSYYLESCLTEEIKSLSSEETSEEHLETAQRNIEALLRDLRTLMNLEEELARYYLRCKKSKHLLDELKKTHPLPHLEWQQHERATKICKDSIFLNAS